MRSPRTAVAALLVTLPLALVTACGGPAGEAKGASEAASKQDVDADPLALLPPDALCVAKVNVHALLAAPFGASVGDKLEVVLPGGTGEADMLKRNVDGVLVGSYSMEHPELLFVVTGRFDEAEFEKAMAASGHNGHPMTSAPYAGFTLHSSDGGAAVRLTSKTVLAGGTVEVKKALDRIAAARPANLTRVVPDWMLQTMNGPGGAVAVAADFSAHPISVSSIGPLPLSWLRPMQHLSVQASLDAGGLRVKSGMTFPGEGQASGAAQGVNALGMMAKLLGGQVKGGLSIDDLQVNPSGATTNVAFVLSQQTLEHALSAVADEVKGAP